MEFRGALFLKPPLCEWTRWHGADQICARETAALILAVGLRRRLTP